MAIIGRPTFAGFNGCTPMKIRNYDKVGEKIALQMTPMIDIVFQLLVFFIMTFKIVSQEGDFNIKMPLTSVAHGAPDVSLPPLKVRLRANESGELTGILLHDQPLESFDQLHQEILGLLGDDTSTAEDAEVEFKCDFDLNYEHVIRAITAVSGYIGRDGSIIKLVEKIRFAPPEGSD